MKKKDLSKIALAAFVLAASSAAPGIANADAATDGTYLAHSCGGGGGQGGCGAACGAQPGHGQPTENACSAGQPNSYQSWGYDDYQGGNNNCAATAKDTPYSTPQQQQQQPRTSGTGYQQGNPYQPQNQQKKSSY